MTMSPEEDAARVPGFLADQMLAHLARWMRILGYDCELVQKGKSNEALAAQAALQGRVLLTGAHALAERFPQTALWIPASQALFTSLRLITSRWPLDFSKTGFSRCSVCNTPVETVRAEQVAHLLPQELKKPAELVTRCPSCNRLYWQGGHVERMKKLLERELGIGM